MSHEYIGTGNLFHRIWSKPVLLTTHRKMLLKFLYGMSILASVNRYRATIRRLRFEELNIVHFLYFYINIITSGVRVNNLFW